MQLRRHAALVLGLGLSTCSPAAPRAEPGKPVPIEALPFAIERPGTYRLAADLEAAGGDGIVVRADGVELDLGGHVLRGGLESGTGVLVPEPVDGLVVRDGAIEGWGRTAVEASTSAGVRLEDLRVARNGGSGLRAGDGARVLRCSASFDWGGLGIEVGDDSVVEGCEVLMNQFGGVRAGARSRLVDCDARYNTYGPGLEVGPGGEVRGGRAEENVRDGIVLGAGAVATGASARANVGHGFRAGDGARLADCTSTDALDGDGFHVGRDAGLERCRTSGNRHHGFAAGPGSRLVDCEARDDDGGALATREGLVIEGGALDG